MKIMFMILCSLKPRFHPEIQKIKPSMQIQGHTHPPTLNCWLYVHSVIKRSNNVKSLINSYTPTTIPMDQPDSCWRCAINHHLYWNHLKSLQFAPVKVSTWHDPWLHAGLIPQPLRAPLCPSWAIAMPFAAGVSAARCRRSSENVLQEAVVRERR